MNSLEISSAVNLICGSILLASGRHQGWGYILFLIGALGQITASLQK